MRSKTLSYMKAQVKMETKILYILTVKCSQDDCELDLECHGIYEIDSNYIYLKADKISREKIMQVEVLEDGKKERSESRKQIIVRIAFLIKEAAIVWVRECFMYIKKNGTKNMAEACTDEWIKILNPNYDTAWFTGGKKVDQWKEEMRLLADNL